MAGLPLTLRVDEITTLPEVADAAALRDASVSCFAELLRGRHEPADVLFPEAEAHHGGDVPPPSWWSDDEAHIGTMRIFKLRDAYLFPAWGVVVTQSGDVMRQSMEEAAYASEDLTKLPFVGRRGGRVVLDLPDAIPHLPQALATMPFGAVMNYGHFVLDGLGGLAALDETGLFAGWPAPVPPLKPWQARHFALLGARPMETAAPILRVGELVYTSAMHHFLHNPNLSYRSLRTRQLAGLGAVPAGRGSRLYLSRGRRDRRPMASEHALVRELRAAGFEAIDTGRMSVDEQIARFAGAEVVVGSAGAAFANVLYCRPATLVIEIQPHGMENHWVRPLCLIGGLRHAVWFCASRAADPRRPEKNMRFDIDVARFLDFAFGFAPLTGSRGRGSLVRRVGRWLGWGEASRSAGR